jgi:tripartite-type tricarboxylate transporter receptor subunit TctC
MSAPGARARGRIRRSLLAWGASGYAAWAVADARPAAWPTRADRPIRLTVAYPPGGVSDATARALARGLSEAAGVPVLVDNLAGAGGVVAMQALSRATPDGHALCFCAISPLALSPHLGAIDGGVVGGIVPVAAVMSTPVLVAGSPDFPAPDFAALMAAARAAPGTIRWASSGVATTGHMVLEHVMRESGTRFVHVPYKGGGQQISDALAGHIDVLSTNVAVLQIAHVAARRLRALAVGAEQRVAELPGVPTLAELGHPNANLGSTFGLFAPSGIPGPTLERVNAAVNQVLQAAVFAAGVLPVGSRRLGGSPASFAALIARESAAHRTLLLAQGPVAR